MSATSILRTLFLSLALLLALQAPAQLISNIDFDEVKKQIETEGGDYYYPALMQKYRDLKAEILIDEAYFLYYGFVFQEGYSPYGIPDEMEALDKWMEKEKWSKALALGPALLKASPFHTENLAKLAYCARNAGNEEAQAFYRNRLLALLEVIAASGDGKEATSAFVVIQVADEYAMLSYFNLEFREQALTGYCDRMSVKTPNDFGQGDVFFNVEKPLKFFSNLIQED